MEASGAFTVEMFMPVDLSDGDEPTTATPVGMARMEKRFAGEISGRSTTLFTYALDHSTNVGGYVAMESVRWGAARTRGHFQLHHSAMTSGG